MSAPTQRMTAAAPPAMRFAVLGPLEVTVDPETIPLGTGEKRVEFRRKGPAVPISHVVVYATAPVRKVVGWFAVGGVETGSPVALWDRFGRIGGVEQGAFDRYYVACEVGLAITVANARALDEPIGLEELALGSRAPQSFRYVDPSLISALEHRCEAATNVGANSPAA